MLLLCGIALTAFSMPMVLVLAAPGWRGFAISAPLTGLGVWWFWHWQTSMMSSPDYHGSPGDAYAVWILLLAVAGYWIAIGIRLLLLAARHIAQSLNETRLVRAPIAPEAKIKARRTS
jgi:hypothetical protein